MRNSRVTSDKPIETAAGLGRHFGVSRTTALAWTKRHDWPGGSGPWGAAELRKVGRWRATLEENRNDDGADAGSLSALQRARLALTVERRVALELQNRITTGKLVDAAEVERGRVARIHAVKARMNALPAEAAKAITELDSIEYVSVEALLQGMVDAICEDFARP